MSIKTKMSQYRTALMPRGSALESVENSDAVANLKQTIDQKMVLSEETLQKLRVDSDVPIKTVEKLTQAINTKGRRAIKAIHQGDEQYFVKHPEALDLLEVIVRTDGSRPSFLIKNGTVDLTGTTDGLWKNILLANKDRIDKAISCVGRIDRAGQQIGSGFLIGKNAIVTNLHVLQSIASKNNGVWKINADATIDFGYEFQGIKSINSRELKSVIFESGKPINPAAINHSKLDMAVIALEPLADDTGLLTLNFDGNINRQWTDNYIYTIGYPGNPGLAGLSNYGIVLEQLYQSTYGFKRLSPGQVLADDDMAAHHSICHDASTLGGNSGSVIIGAGKETAAAALHYGGTLAPPKQNWGHLLAATLELKDKKTGTPLHTILRDQGTTIETV